MCCSKLPAWSGSGTEAVTKHSLADDAQVEACQHVPVQLALLTQTAQGSERDVEYMEMARMTEREGVGGLGKCEPKNYEC